MRLRQQILAVIGLLSVSVISLTVQAEQLRYKPGEMIVQLDKGVDIGDFSQKLHALQMTPVRLLSKRLNIWLCSFVESYTPLTEAVTSVYTDKNVLAAQLNHVISLRSIPDDPRFNEQWALHNTGQTGGLPDADIDAPEAWDLVKGDTTVQGDEIVIAIIDDGFDLTHPDLNFWKNEHEIAGNGIDDDLNGYIDDVDGWNAISSNGVIFANEHGTHVAGIAGAIGNNGLGITGVDWNLKVMPIIGSSTEEAVVIEAYSYALEMRAIYNETGGDSGAFVVITNSSFGVNYGNPSEYPIWCGLYDSLGTYGILSCAATSNLNLDVDIEGDIPTACSSDWLISVTNTTNRDEKFFTAAFGKNSIDLGAPGTNILSTIPVASFGIKSGTSMSAPAVAGAIALLYSTASSELISLSKYDPANTALLFKDFILAGTDPVESLQDITVTGGRLNLYNSVQLVNLYPDSADPAPPGEFTVYSDYHSPSSIQLKWQDPHSFFGGDTLLPQEFQIMIKREGLPIDSVDGGTEEYLDTGLNDGQYYDYQIFTKIIGTDSISQDVEAGWIAGGAPQPMPPQNFYLSIISNDYSKAHWINPKENVDGTPLDDLAGILLFEDGVLLETFTRSTIDTGAIDSALFLPSPGSHEYYLKTFDNENPVNESVTSNINFSPILLPFFDDFKNIGEPDPDYWLNGGAQISDSAINPPSPPFALTLDNYPAGGDTVTLLPVDLSSFSDSGYVFSYWFQAQGMGDPPETGDSLLLEFKDSGGIWQKIKSYPGTTVFPFIREILKLDSINRVWNNNFFNNDFQLRFRSLSSGRTNSYLDQWLIDDIYMGPPNSNPILLLTPKALTDTLEIGQIDSLEILIKNNQPAPSLLNFNLLVPQFDWLTVFPDSGELKSQEELTLSVVLDASHLSKGNYKTKFFCVTNDSTSLVDTVGINLLVVEPPGITTYPDSILFDTLYVEKETIKYLQIRNNGLDSMIISQIVSTDSVFSADSSGFTIAPLDSFELAVRFSPLAARYYQGWLIISTITAGLKPDSTFLQGVGIYPPEIVVNPSAIIYSLTEGDSTDYVINISNVGGSNLNWQASVFAAEREGSLVDSTHYLPFLRLMAPFEGVIPIGGKDELALRLYGVFSESDSQKAVIVIKSNDPVRSEVEVRVDLDVISILELEGGLPKEWLLESNYPNPFNPETTIKFQLPEAAEVKLMVYNILGQKVKILLDKHLAPGYYRVNWDGLNEQGEKVSSGLYIYRLESKVYTNVKKMMIIR